MKQIDYYICPGCGDDVKVGSKGCPKCNNLDPWEMEDLEVYDGLDLPENFEDQNLRYRKLTLHPVWVITAAALLVILVMMMLFRAG